MALNCNIDKDKIRDNIERTVSELATNTGLFTSVNEYTLIPTSSQSVISAKLAEYTPQMIDVYKNMAIIDPMGFLQFVAEQSRTANFTEDNINKGIGAFPEGLVKLAQQTFPNRSEFDIPTSTQVAYTLDAVKKLSTPKADEIFAKGQKNNWDLNKILTELQLQKEQKELILSTGLTTKEAIVDSLLNNFSFTVEVNTATSKDFFYRIDISEYLDHQGEPQQDEIFSVELPDGTIQQITEQEFKAAKENAEVKLTQHYANMTVPGGTNYTENEIRTPDITPSIKGHAAFSTDKGIGWFRSDEQAPKSSVIGTKDHLSTETQEIEERSIYPKGYSTKTRRILEIQSDWGQKIRKSSEHGIHVDFNFEEVVRDLEENGDLKIICD